MADNTTLNTGSGGDVIATDDIGGVKHQRVKVQHGADGSATDVSEDSPMPVSQSKKGTVKTMLSRYLDLAGNGTGVKNINGDYTTPDIAYIQPPAGTVYRITRMLVSIVDAQVMAATEYGNLGGALANGITVRTQDDGGTLIDLTDGIPITTNADWTRVCYDVEKKTWGPGDEHLTVRWTFSRSDTQIRLDGDSNERLEVVLSDDLTGLTGHYFLVQGYVE